MPATQTASPTETDVATARAEVARLAAEGRTADAVGAALAVIDGLCARLHKSEDEREEYRKLLLHLKEEVERLKRGLLGQKAERFPRNGAQLSLALLAMGVAGSSDAATGEATVAEVEEQLIREHTRRKPKRKPLPEELPRTEIEIVPPEVEREPDAFEQIGEETREVLERRPAATVAVKFVYKKFVRRDKPQGRTEILVADAVELPIPRGIAGPGLLADTIVKRWQDHQPLNRQSEAFARDGLDISKSTICDWHGQTAALARPVYKAMFADAFTAPYLCVDATGVLVLAKDRCKNTHFWVVVAPDMHVLFVHTQRHDAEAVDEVLEGYKGHLVADAHIVYDHLYVGGDVVEVGCWAHARRWWWKAVPSDPERAKKALDFIAALFLIERSIAGSPRKKKREIRQEKSRPIVEAFFAFCQTERDCVLDESPVATAIGYALNQKEALKRFLDDGALPLHNNVSELNLRRQVIGRRNWLFCGSDDGAEVNTIWVSLLASARMHRIEPLGYVRDLLCLLPRWPKHRALDLAPAYWKRTIAQPEVQQMLDSNLLRQVALGLRQPR
jgi:transposase